MKLCTSCLEVLDERLFYKNITTKDGLQYNCKNCQRLQHLQHRIDRPDLYAKYVSDCAKRHKERTGFSYSHNHWKNKKDHHQARNKTWNKIRTCKIVKPNSCNKCGTVGFVEVHHPDYSKPDMIVFLCIKCHLNAHGKELRSKNVR